MLSAEYFEYQFGAADGTDRHARRERRSYTVKVPPKNRYQKTIMRLSAAVHTDTTATQNYALENRIE